MSRAASAPTTSSSSTRPKCRVRRPRRSCRARLCLRSLSGSAPASRRLLLEHFDDTVRSPEEVEQVSGLATLGIIPKVGVDAAAEEELADPRSALSEAYRSLCTALQFSTESGLPKTLVVTSAGPSEGKSITSLAIARHFATHRAKVLLVDADLRNPSLHAKLGCDNAIGLSNYLTGACTPPEAFQATAIPIWPSWRRGRCRPMPPIFWQAAPDVAALGRARGLRSDRHRRAARHGARRCAAAVECRGRHRLRRRRRAGAPRPRSRRA